MKSKVITVEVETSTNNRDLKDLVMDSLDCETVVVKQVTVVVVDATKKKKRR